jgi:hypothetical protein
MITFSRLGKMALLYEQNHCWDETLLVFIFFAEKRFSRDQKANFMRYLSFQPKVVPAWRVLNNRCRDPSQTGRVGEGSYKHSTEFRYYDQLDPDILSLVSLYSLSVSHKLGLRIIIHHSFAHAVLVQEENVNYTVNSVHLFQFLEQVFYNRKFQCNRLHVFKKKSVIWHVFHSTLRI